LVVTNAGANYMSIYEPNHSFLDVRWSQSPVMRKAVGAEETFRQVNSENKMEGGPKGIAIHGNQLAVCSPQIGIAIYSFREGNGLPLVDKFKSMVRGALPRHLSARA
jgi:hypothetical protein